MNEEVGFYGVTSRRRGMSRHEHAWFDGIQLNRQLVDRIIIWLNEHLWVVTWTLDMEYVPDFSGPTVVNNMMFFENTS